MFYIIYGLQVELFCACQQNYQFSIKLSKELYRLTLFYSTASSILGKIAHGPYRQDVR